MQGTVVKVAVTDGQQVAVGDLLLVLEAMKMEQPINAHKAGTVKKITAQPGTGLTSRRRHLRDHQPAGQQMTATAGPLRPQ